MCASHVSHGMKVFAGAALVGVLAAGCGGEQAAQPDPSEKGILDRDVAETVASDIARDSGGLVDQVADLLEMACGATFDEEFRAQGPGYLWANLRSAEYDEFEGHWTLVIERERGAPTDEVYLYAERVYEVSFQDDDGTPQKYFDTDGALASRIALAITSGSGEHRCPAGVHRLNSVSGSFVATGTDQVQMTVNGTYHRDGVSTIVTADAELTVSRWLDLTVTDMVGPRGADPTVAQAISGTLTGELRADVDSAGGLEQFRTVDRSIAVTLGGGNAVITSGTASYIGDLQAGGIQTEAR